jgi:hypothetical protein
LPCNAKGRCDRRLIFTISADRRECSRRGEPSTKPSASATPIFSVSLAGGQDSQFSESATSRNGGGNQQLLADVSHPMFWTVRTTVPFGPFERSTRRPIRPMQMPRAIANSSFSAALCCAERASIRLNLGLPIERLAVIPRETIPACRHFFTGLRCRRCCRACRPP